ncbi:MAG: aminoacyl-tRNA hydrolase [Gemmatimonadaceae bacterium]|jgi:ribosome-associated protein|nr:aminoacyl-tRNA hydrolase [Gemmatimonadaceae bacterium]
MLPDDLAMAAADDALVVSPRVRIPRRELEIRAVRARGPGGQHVNKSATRVEIVWAPGASTAFDDVTRERVVAYFARRLDKTGRMRIASDTHRSQLMNRLEAEERLVTLVRRAIVPPKVRRPTKPTRASVERRLDAKRREGARKQERRRPHDE